MPNTSSTLVDRLIEAAAEAIRQQAFALEHDPRRLRGLVIDLTVLHGSRVDEATCYVERHVKLSSGPRG